MSNSFHGLIRRHVTVTAVAIGVGGVWGSLAAITVKLAFDLQETDAWLYVGVPVAVLVVLLIGKKLPQILGFEA